VDGLLTGVLVSAAGNVIDWMGNALAQAAKEDREGKATKGTSPAYLWWREPKSKTYSLMSCAVVTLSGSNPAGWCDKAGSPFAKSAPAVCRYFKDLQSPANQKPSLTPASWKGQSLPTLYAEIELEAAADKRGVLPKLVALYYPPKSIHGGKFDNGKQRTLQLTVAAATAEGSSALGSLVIRLDDTLPDAEVQLGEAIRPAGARAWAAALAVPEKYSPPEEGGSIIPVNVTSEVREIGDPNRFLQALAVAFAGQKDALKEEVKARITTATTESDPNAVQSTYDTQAALIYAAEAKVRSACKVAPPATRNPSAVRSEFLGLLEAHRKLAALPAPGQPITFVPDKATLEQLHSGAADDICNAFP
jgi:hypothetical protein